VYDFQLVSPVDVLNWPAVMSDQLASDAVIVARIETAFTDLVHFVEAL
jgi:hypothetical protein